MTTTDRFPADGPERPARFAGSWYPGDPDELARDVDAALAKARARGAVARRARVIVAPHAGYRYSLAIAAEAYARVEVPEIAVVLCPNHTVPPPIVSCWPGGAWRTPLGRLPIDGALANAIAAGFPAMRAERGAHLDEHAVELHLPILQRRRAECAGRDDAALRLVPIVVAASDLSELEQLGRAIADATRGRDDVLIVASTDMTHHRPAEVARRQDERALAPLLALDPGGLLDVVTRERISMCGVRPTVAALAAARELGATGAELCRYGHSGEVSGDLDSVVGYAACLVR